MDLADLLVIEQLVPRLHALVGTALANDLEELHGGELPVRIGEIGRVGRADGVDTVTAITVHVPPLPPVVDVLVGRRRPVALRGEDRWTCLSDVVDRG